MCYGLEQAIQTGYTAVSPLKISYVIT